MALYSFLLDLCYGKIGANLVQLFSCLCVKNSIQFIYLKFIIIIILHVKNS
jgi:hypothetical protein